MDKMPTQKKRSGIFTFSLFSARIRAGYVVMLLCIGAASILMYTERHQLPILGIILGSFSLFVLSYVDQWSFNCTEKTAAYRTGLIFFAFKAQYPFSAIETTETERFTKGVFKTQFIKCVLCLRSGEKKTVAIFPSYNKALVRRWETLTAVFAGQSVKSL